MCRNGWLETGLGWCLQSSVTQRAAKRRESAVRASFRNVSPAVSDATDGEAEAVGGQITTPNTDRNT